MALKIQLRRGTAAEWTSANPVLMQGEMGVETDTLKVKLGNGTTAWTSLPYFTQGAKGDTGATGATGATGPRGLKGDVGDTGPANTLTMGTVTTGPAGSSASATITGTAPNQTLNLVIPKGDKGDTGTAATITVGTVTALAAGSAPTVVNAGTSGAAVFNFGIPNAVGVPTGGTTGQVVRKTASSTEWATLSTSDLNDVAIATPSNGQALTFDSATGKWKNATPAANLSQLGDVTIATPADKQVLQYESASGKWKNKTATGGVTVGSANPSSPIDGDGWFYAEDGTLFVRYNDGNSTQWVQPNAVLSSQIEQRYYSPNYIINGAFDFWQRGTSLAFGTGLNYLADRFFNYNSGSGSVTSSQQAFTPGTSPAPGFEAQFFHRTVIASTGTSTLVNIGTPIEDVRTCAGQTVTFSFYAKAAANRTITSSAYQNFGTGGSATVTAWTGASFALTTSWQRFTYTTALPSIAGRTVGTSSKLQIEIELGASTGTVDIWGVQLETGSTATQFRRTANSLQGELAACQRYYQRIDSVGQPNKFLGSIAYYNGTSSVGLVPLITEMRAVPSISLSAANTFQALTAQANITVSSIGANANDTSTRMIALDVVTTTVTTTAAASLRANGTTSTVIQASSEL